MSERSLTWDTLDWPALERLRETFIGNVASRASYWTSRSDVANYDFTYAQRIGWKWDAVLRELRGRGWMPPRGPLLDWGCGSGIAGRRVLECFGAEHFPTLRVFDRSTLAMEFAVDAARREFPSLRVEHVDPTSAGGDESGGVLVLSHLLNELDETGGQALRQVIDRAAAVLWVEPGTSADSRALIAVRESLREKFLLIAPCPHQRACGLLAAENARHWCHHFASPPPGLLADSGWVRFAQRAGLDLRSLPYSFLVLERKGLREPVPGILPEGWSRVLGEPRVYKGFAKILSCQADGVRELELQKRAAPEVFKAMKSAHSPAFLRGEQDHRRFQNVRETR